MSDYKACILFYLTQTLNASELYKWKHIEIKCLEKKTISGTTVL